MTDFCSEKTTICRVSFLILVGCSERVGPANCASWRPGSTCWSVTDQPKLTAVQFSRCRPSLWRELRSVWMYVMCVMMQLISYCCQQLRFLQRLSAGQQQCKASWVISQNHCRAAERSSHGLRSDRVRTQTTTYLIKGSRYQPGRSVTVGKQAALCRIRRSAPILHAWQVYEHVNCFPASPWHPSEQLALILKYTFYTWLGACEHYCKALYKWNVCSSELMFLIAGRGIGSSWNSGIPVAQSGQT